MMTFSRQAFDGRLPLPLAVSIACIAWAALGTSVGGCGGASSPAKFPSRPEGCDVTVYEDAPTEATEDIGTVSQRCDPSVTDADCTRGLLDEVCRLGGDVAWGVARKPEIVDGYKRLRGRAAKRTEKESSSP